MTTTLLITTYNWPEALRLVLESAFKQTVLPDEIVIADDGSGEETRTLIEKMTAKSPVPIKHVWHEDKGFRLAMIRNKGVAASTADYILQVDGDCILSKHYVEDHLRMSRPGRIIGGGRVKLDDKWSNKALSTPHFDPDQINLLALSKRARNAKYLFRSKTIMNLYSWIYTSIKGENTGLGSFVSYWKKDFLAVNGYDESFEGWGYEDSDFDARMFRNGIKPARLRFSGFLYHLNHPQSNKYYDPKENPNCLKKEEHDRNQVIRISKGVDQWINGGKE